MRVLGPIGDKVLFENEFVRVWSVTLDPGQRQPWHQHLLPYLIVPLTEGRNEMTFDDGRIRQTQEKPGEVIWREPGIPHELLNCSDWQYRNVLVFISGMTSRRADGTIAGIGDIEAQTRQVCENLKAAVEEAGGTMDDICRVDVYVRNMEHFEQIHKVRREYFRPPAPASTMVEISKMTSPEYLIEINAIAVIGE
jgi:enamine deaminase RidA (YjgF/YER057c/UK114 family)